MLIIEWVMRLPRAEGVFVVRKIATNAGPRSEAVAQAHGLWDTERLRENRRSDGFQVPDQDGHMVVHPRFSKEDHLAA